MVPIVLMGTFASVLVIGLTLGMAKVQRQATLDVLEAQAGRSSNLRQQELSQSFADRAFLPAISRIRAMGIRLTPIGMRKRLQRKLVLAGSPAAWDAEKLAAVKVVGGVVLGLWGGFVATRLGLAGIGWLGITAIIAALGFFGPDAILDGRVRAREEAIRIAMPDTIDLLSISVEAGLGFDAALAQSVKHIPGPLSQEMRRMLQEIQLGVPRPTAFRNLADRTNVEELNAFVLAMIQADVFGVSVANVLRSQATELRTRRRQRAEHRAMQVPVKILFPLVFCILPALFAVVLGPGAIRIFQGLFGGTVQ